MRFLREGWERQRPLSALGRHGTYSGQPGATNSFFRELVAHAQKISLSMVVVVVFYVFLSKN
ncbi:MAG: hypothetical protein KKC03_00395 [Bacteroidetes bacterium]|nr:hypothetical protein [Bacteroidota bacterium]